MNNYLDLFKNLISDDFLVNAELTLQENINGVNSFVISSPMTAYRSDINNVLFARIKVNGKRPYISFKSKYKYMFDKLDIPTYEVKSDTGYFRIDLDEFFNSSLLQYDFDINDLSKILNTIFLDSMSFQSFGCCSKYKECSYAKKCLHSDQLYATACMYRKNLESGHIFY